MPDVFNRADTTFGGSFSTEDASIVFSTGGGAGADPGASGGVGLLTQNTQFQYGQQITRLYEIGSNNVFYVAGRTQGSAGVGRILGPRKVQTAFYTNYGDVCNAANNALSIVLSAGCTSASSPQGVGAATGTLAYNLTNVVIASIGLNVAAEQMIVNEQLQMVYVALELQGG